MRPDEDSSIYGHGHSGAGAGSKVAILGARARPFTTEWLHVASGRAPAPQEACRTNRPTRPAPRRPRRSRPIAPGPMHPPQNERSFGPLPASAPRWLVLRGPVMNMRRLRGPLCAGHRPLPRNVAAQRARASTRTAAPEAVGPPGPGGSAGGLSRRAVCRTAASPASRSACHPGAIST